MYSLLFFFTFSLLYVNDLDLLCKWCGSFPFLHSYNRHLLLGLIPGHLLPGKAFLFLKPFSLHTSPTWSFILTFSKQIPFVHMALPSWPHLIGPKMGGWPKLGQWIFLPAFLDSEARRILVQSPSGAEAISCKPGEISAVMFLVTWRKLLCSREKGGWHDT